MAREDAIEGIFDDLSMPKRDSMVNRRSIPNWKFERFVMRNIVRLEERIREEEIEKKAEKFKAQYD